MNIRQTLAFAVLMAVSCFAADADGKWTGSMNTPNGALPVAFQFQTDGATLNGSTTGPDGREVKIVNGKVDGESISFMVTYDFGGNALTINYEGVLANGQIKFTLEVMGMPFELTVSRAA